MGGGISLGPGGGISLGPGAGISFGRPASTPAEYVRAWYRHRRAARPGRRRNPVLAQQRKAKALELLAAGGTYRQVAKQLGYANPGSGHHLVHRELRKQVSHGVELLRRLELDRLDAVQDALWDAAIAGNLSAAETIRRIVQDRVRLLSLNETPVRAGHRTPRTVVVGPLIANRRD